jgi:3-oxo-5alpha-steroid 4-dehydrogenase
LFSSLRKAAERAGVDVRPYTQARRLVVADDGTVVGVELREVAKEFSWRLLHRILFQLTMVVGGMNPRAALFLQKRLLQLEAVHGRSLYVYARGGVVLSAGGFIFNPEMLHQYAPGFPPCSLSLGTAGDSGQGIRLGQSAGGKVARMDRCTAWRFINPPLAWLRGALVGPNGARICSEELYGGAIGEYMAEAHGGRGVLVLDATAMNAARVQVRKDRMQSFQRAFGFINNSFNRKKAGTLEDLGKACGMPPGALPKAIEEYNKGALAGTDACGKSKDYLYPIEVPPFYGIVLDFDRKMFMTPSMTLGGLVVDGTTARVVGEDGKPIEGLYAAGRNAVGVSSNFYVSGLSIGDCVFSGRNAGRHAAARAGHTV